MRNIILASQSAWRKEIFAKTRLPFTTEQSHFEEDLSLPLPQQALAKKMALGKALDVASRHLDAIIIAADTFAVLGKHRLGKPHTPKRARETLTLLSGKWHTAITGLAIIDTRTNKRIIKAIETKVHFRRLSKHEIDAYIRTGEPLGVAGAYAIQSGGALLVDKIEGDFWNIVGLPIATVVGELQKFGIWLK